MFADYLTIAYLIMLALAIAWTLYYFQEMPEKPKLYFNPDSELSTRLVSRCPSLHGYYWPLFWCTNSHINAFLGIFLWHLRVLKFEERLHVPLEDGGTVSVDLHGFHSRSKDDAAPTILVLHGLTGDSHDFTRFAKEANERGFRV